MRCIAIHTITDCPVAGAFFTTYEACKAGLKKIDSASGGQLIPQPLIDSASSSVAELVSCFILTPAEVLKQNAQMVRKPAHGDKSRTSVFQPSATMQALKTFQKPSQLFRGYTALAARNLPFTAMQFPMFEHLKLKAKDYRKEKGIATGTIMETATITGLCAGAAGSIAAVITTPVDVVKTRIMLSAAGTDSEKDAKQMGNQARTKEKSVEALAKEKGGMKKTSLQVAREIVKEGGVKGLFRGGALRGVWTALGSGLYLGVYESGRVWLGDRRANEEE